MEVKVLSVQMRSDGQSHRKEEDAWVPTEGLSSSRTHRDDGGGKTLDRWTEDRGD
jgi:hypothetical protein